MGGSGKADAAGFGDCLEPGRDVDAVAEDVVGRDDDVADIDADAKQQTHRIALTGREHADAVLKLRRSPDGIHGACKFGKEAVARGLDHAAAMPGDRWQDGLAHQRGEPRMRHLFILVHQARITDGIRHQDRGEPPLDTFVGHQSSRSEKIHQLSPDLVQYSARQNPKPSL